MEWGLKTGAVGWAVSPEHSSQPLVDVEGPAQPLNPFVQIKPFVHSEVCFHKSFSYSRNAKPGIPPAAQLQEGLSVILITPALCPGRRQYRETTEDNKAGTQKDDDCICRKPLMFPRLRGPCEQARNPHQGNPCHVPAAWSGKGLHPCLSEAKATTVSSHATPPSRAGLLLIIQGGQRAAGTRK